MYPKQDKTGSHIVRDENRPRCRRRGSLGRPRRAKSKRRCRTCPSYMTRRTGQRPTEAAMERSTTTKLTDRERLLLSARRASKSWLQLTDYVDAKDMEPLAIDATTNSLYELKKFNGRMALYRMKLGRLQGRRTRGFQPERRHRRRRSRGRWSEGHRLYIRGGAARVIYFDEEFDKLL